jgi:two-component system response regulator AtoC
MSVTTTFPIIARGAGGALIASPSSSHREQVLQNLNGRWRPVHHALGGAEALEKLEKGNWQVLFLDPRLPDLASEELIAIIQRRFPEIQVVLLDSDAGLPGDDGAKTDLSEPEAVEEPEAAGEDAWSSGIARGSQYEPLPGMIGRSEAMQRVYRLAQLVAPRSTTVLIWGRRAAGRNLWRGRCTV